jgi:hypothetical protein
VQFQCTKCKAVVKVPAAGGGPGAKRATGGLPAGRSKRPTAGLPGKRGAPAGGPVARGPVAAPGAAGGRPGAQQGGRPQYGPPSGGGSNTGLIIGGVVGVVAIGLIILVVVVSSGPSPQDIAAQQAEERHQEREQAVKRRAEEQARTAAEIQAPLDAALEAAQTIESALRNEDRTVLEGLFDWDIYAAYISELAQQNDMWLTYPLRAEGHWAKDESGERFTGRYEGTSMRGASSLRQRVMDYMSEYFFGISDIRWERSRSELDGAMFSLNIRDVPYLGRIIYVEIPGAGGVKEFYVGARRGSTDVKILYFNDGSANRTLRDNEAANERRPADASREEPTGHFREGYDPSHRDTREGGTPREPGDDRGGMEVEEGDIDDDLPELAKTNANPTRPALVNCVNDLRRRGSLNEARRGQVRSEPSSAEKKATMGAFIDQLIDAVNSNDRDRKHRISNELWTIWRSFVPQDWGKDDMTFEIGFGGSQSSDQMKVRRWLWVYNDYPLDD